MTQDEIIRMAREAGGALSCIAEPLEHPWKFNQTELESFAALVAEATKERAARICDVVLGDNEVSAVIRSMK
jgi:hypothetical protein